MKLPSKRRQGEGPTPPGGGKFRTQRGVTGSESRAPEPSSAELKPGARPPCLRGLAAPEEGGGGKQGGEVAINAWTSTATLCLPG